MPFKKKKETKREEETPADRARRIAAERLEKKANVYNKGWLEDFNELKSPPEEGLMLVEDIRQGAGLLIFSLADVPGGRRYRTTRGTIVHRVNESTVLIGEERVTSVFGPRWLARDPLDAEVAATRDATRAVTRYIDDVDSEYADYLTAAFIEKEGAIAKASPASTRLLRLEALIDAVNDEASLARKGIQAFEQKTERLRREADQKAAAARDDAAAAAAHMTAIERAEAAAEAAAAAKHVAARDALFRSLTTDYVRATVALHDTMTAARARHAKFLASDFCIANAVAEAGAAQAYVDAELAKAPNEADFLLAAAERRAAQATADAAVVAAATEAAAAAAKIESQKATKKKVKKAAAAKEAELGKVAVMQQQAPAPAATAADAKKTKKSKKKVEKEPDADDMLDAYFSQ